MEEEHFEVFTEQNEKGGIKLPRSVVHRDGHYHRSVNILIFNQEKDKILIQKRSDTKDVCPNLWDMSVCEHLKPGETYYEAATRGVFEELSLRVEQSSFKPLNEPHLFKYESDKKKDFEFQQTMFLTCDGHFTIDPNEISDAKFVDYKELTCRLKSSPHEYTPWMNNEFELLSQSGFNPKNITI
eukprot:TRINITY_DN9122_c0_g1_i1.p1 TRINITY_DN9122_c0_g1~~TRINITY_DN9122_c0_g1_i1.p1  ORF type:complete len:184 (-),score=19.49 TRINITY_DN9122_c0_g1_i1:128-679(-)